MPKLMSPVEVAGMLGVSVRFVYERTTRNTTDPLPFRKIGKFVRFFEHEITAWVEDRKQNG